MMKSQLFQARKILTALIMIISFFVFAANVNAEEEIATKSFFINLDKATIAKGYTVAAFADNIKLSLIPGILDESTGVDVLELREPMIEPWQFERVSEIYQFEFRNKAAYDNVKPFIIQLYYQADDHKLKQVYYYDKNYGSWQPLPTKDYINDKMARAYIHLPFARVAVFSNPEIMSSGKATWYRYQGGDFAASPDFPKGSKLRVWNHSYEKYVDVEINDYGPDRSLHPERVIDLDKTAFQKLAPLGAGVINVSVEPLYIPEERGRVLGVKLSNTTDVPESHATAAIVMDINANCHSRLPRPSRRGESGNPVKNSQPSNNEIPACAGMTLFSKNIDQVLPLASLTKLVTASVFLDTNSDFDQVVAYSKADEEITWEHVDKYDSASLRIADGDQLTVRDLFLSTLMASTNNTAETLVRISGLSREEFISRMNAKAHEWGAASTVFIEPTGLSPKNVSTVKDYVIISAQALQRPKMLEATTLKQYQFASLVEEKKFRLINTNKLLWQNFYVTGGKTGMLDEAGYCLMTKIKDGERELVGVLFGAKDRWQSFDEMGDLLKYTSKKLESL